MLHRFIIAFLIVFSVELLAEEPKIKDLQDSVLIMIEKKHSPTEIEIILNNVYLYYEFSSPINGIEYFSDLFEFSVVHNNPFAQQNILNSLSRFYRKIGLNDLALEYLANSIQIQEDRGKVLYNGWNYVEMGNLYYDHKDFSNAISQYRKAIEVFKMLINSKDVSKSSIENALNGHAVAYNNIALCKLRLNKLDSAMNNFNHALEYRKKINYEVGVADSYFYIGKLFMQQNKIDSAFYYLNKSYDSFISLANTTGKDRNFCFASQVEILKEFANYYLKHDLIKTYNYVQRIDSLITSENLHYLKIEYYLLMADYFDEKSDIGSINKLLSEALDYVQKHNFDNTYSLIYNKLYSYNKKYNNAELSLRYLELSKQYDDSLITSLRKNNFLGVQNKIKLKTVEKNIAKVLAEKEISEIKLSKQKLWTIMLFVFSIGTGITIFIFLKLMSTKTKLNNELLKLNTKLEESKNALEKTNSEKDKFFSIIAHDLRNPIGAIKSLTEVLVKNYEIFNHDERKEFTEDIASSVNSVSKLLDNLLTWSRSQRGIIEVHAENFNLRTLVTSNIDILSNWAHEKQISLINDIDKSFTVFADASMINIILQNLISNSIKYTQRTGYVKVSCYESEDYYEVSVQDNGIGMPESIRRNIFEVNSSVSRPGTSNEAGTGLGLIVSKEFIEKHGGAIGVESAEYKGSRFYFRIPK